MLKNKLSSIGTVVVIAAHILFQPSMMAEDDSKLGRQVFAKTMRLAHPAHNPDDHNGLLHYHTFIDEGMKISIFEDGTFIKEDKAQEVGKWTYKDGYLELTMDGKLFMEFRVSDNGRRIVPIEDREVAGEERAERAFKKFQETSRAWLAYQKEKTSKALDKAAAVERELARVLDQHALAKKEASVALAQAAAAKQKADAAYAQAAAAKKKADTAYVQLDVEKNKTSDALAQAAVERKKADAALVQAAASKEEAATALAQAAASKEEVTTAYAQVDTEKKRARDSFNRLADRMEAITREMNKDLPLAPSADIVPVPAPVDPDVAKPAPVPVPAIPAPTPGVRPFPPTYKPIGLQAPGPNRGGASVPVRPTLRPPYTIPRMLPTSNRPSHLPIIGRQAPGPNRGDDPGVRFGDDIIIYQDGKPTFTPVEKLKNSIPGSPSERHLQEQLLAKERQETQVTLRNQKNEADYQKLADRMEKNNLDHSLEYDDNRKRLNMLEQKYDIRRAEEVRAINNSHNPLSIPRTPLPYTPPSIPRTSYSPPSYNYPRY